MGSKEGVIEHSRKAVEVAHSRCEAIHRRCQDQRDYLTLERIALQERARFHNLPYKYKSFLYLQYAVDRRTKKLIESASEMEM